MIKYIKDSIRELKHVVWPTREETKNYFITVTVVLVLFWIYLFIVSTIFTESLFGLKKLVNNNSSDNTVSTIDVNKLKDIKSKLKVNSIQVEKATSKKETSKITTEKKAVITTTWTWVSK